jgi:Uma2 family endonuclease
VLILKYRDDFYSDGHPQPPDVHLRIEVADDNFEAELLSRPGYDTAHQVREVWMVDMKGASIHVFRDCGEDSYREQFVASGADAIAPAAFPDFTATVREILGK